MVTQFDNLLFTNKW